MNIRTPDGVGFGFLLKLLFTGGVAREIEPINVCHGQEFDEEVDEILNDQIVELAARAELR